MQINKNQVIEVNLRDLFFHVLYRWRGVLIAAMIGAIALGGYQYMSIKKVHDEGKLTKEERQYQLNLQKYQDDLENNRNIISINTRLLQGQNQYRKESVYFQLDSQKVWTASALYLVKADFSVLEQIPQGSAVDPADGILSAYSTPLSEATDVEMKETFGIENPEYVSELVVTTIEPENNTVLVEVKGASKESAQAGLKLLEAKMEELAANKAQSIDKHELTLVSESISQGTDDDLAEKQSMVADNVTKLQNTLQSARQALDKLESQDEPQAPGKHLLRMAAVGFILGAFLKIFLYALLYIFDGKLHNSRDLSVRYRLPIFGEFKTSGSLHGNRGLDKLFYAWEKGRHTLDDESVCDNIAALIGEKQGTKTVLLVSTLAAEALTAVQEALKKRLPDKTVNIQADMNHNSVGIAEAASADLVLLVEKKDASYLKETDRLVENLIIVNANVPGAIKL